jgi:hypothetical protein
MRETEVKYILWYFVCNSASLRFEPEFEKGYSYLVAHCLEHVMVLTAAELHAHEHSHRQMSVSYVAFLWHAHGPLRTGKCLVDLTCKNIKLIEYRVKNANFISQNAISKVFMLGKNPLRADLCHIVRWWIHENTRGGPPVGGLDMELKTPPRKKN